MLAKPKKSLGQNFLVDKNIQRKIIASCDLMPSDVVLEIGAGRAELTKTIARMVKKVYAIEIDVSLSEFLKQELKDYANVQIINQDILKLDLNKLSKQKLKVVGNIPYYISSPIIEHLIKYREKIDTIFISVQKEFAKRLAAPCGSKDFGSLSCFVQYYTEPEAIFYIKKNCFYPVPKVDSCFLRLNLQKKSRLSKQREKFLFKIIRAAFNKRRKTLRNSLQGIILKKNLEEFFSKYGIDSNIRPEGLSLENFIKLAN